jgi:hypothetical protein
MTSRSFDAKLREARDSLQQTVYDLNSFYENYPNSDPNNEDNGMDREEATEECARLVSAIENDAIFLKGVLFKFQDGSLN